MRSLTLVILLAVAAAGAAEVDLDTLEQLALGDRAAAIARMAPGSAEQWYWRVVQAQSHDPAAAARLIDEAAAALHDDDLIRRLRLRQAAITWDSDPQAGKRLAEGLAPAAVPAAPEADPAQAATTGAGLDALREDLEPGDYRSDGLVRLLATATGERRHALLGRLEEPIAPNLVAALAADAVVHADQAFGSLPIHRLLTADQLTRLAAAVPRFAAEAAFQRLRLQHAAGLHAVPGWQRDPAARRAYAEALLAVADRPVLAWAAAAAQDELLCLDAAAGDPPAERLAAWYAARAAAQAAKDAIPQGEIRTLTGLPEREVTRLLELSADRLLGASAQPPAWAACLGEADLPARHAAARVLHGHLDPERVSGALGGAAAAQALRDRRELDFWPAQETALPSDAPVAVRLVAKRCDHLALRLWHLDEEAVARQGGSLDVGIDLAGIEPQATVAVPLDGDPWLRQEAVVPLPQIDAPGAWLVEALGADRAVRLLLRRGAIELVAGTDAQGNRAVVIDERGRVQTDARVWIDALAVPAGADGVIRLPDGRGASERLVASAGGRACAATLELPSEAYTLDAHLLGAREHLLAGTTARLVFGVRLGREHSLGALPLARLHAPQLTLRWTGRDKRPLGVQHQALTLADDRDAVVAATVPEGVVELEWRIDGAVSLRSTGAEQPLSDHGWFSVSPGIEGDVWEDVVLRRDADGWVASLRGRSGEEVPGVACMVAIENRWGGTPSPIRMRSAAAGGLRLGRLAEAQQIRVLMSEAHGAVWQADLEPVQLPPPSLCVPGAELALPRARAPRVFRVAGGCFLAEVPEALHRAERGFSLRCPVVGDYRILDGGQSTTLAVRAGAIAAGLHLGPGVAAEVPPAPASLVATVGATALDLQLAGLGAGARVHLLPIRLWPDHGDVQVPRGRDAAVRLHDWLPPEGALGRRSVGAEEWYSLNRRRQPHLAGVMLDRPGPLLDPWNPPDDAMPWMGEGGGAGALGSRTGGGRKKAIGRGGGSKASEYGGMRLAPDWLAEPNPVLDHLRPDAQGRISVPLARLGDAHVVVAVASDGDRFVTAYAVLPVQPLPLRERRLNQALPADATIGVVSGLSVLAAGERLDLPNLPGSRARLVASVADFIDLLHAGWPEVDLGPFARLGAWPDLDAAARRRLWDEGASHELHLFLARHDPALARQVSAYRAQVLVPDAMLAALCGLDAAPWLLPGVDLNPLERVLLGDRLGADRAAVLRRQVQDAAIPVQPDPRRRAAIVAALLAGAEPAAATPPALEKAPDVPKRVGQEDGKVSIDNLSDNRPILRGPLGDPKTWVESRWWHEKGRAEIDDGPLWAAYASRDQAKPFLPAVGLELLRSGTELRAALALADLPFVPAAHRWEERADGRTLVAAGPLLVAHRQVRQLPRAEGTVSLYRRTCILEAWKADRATAATIAGALATGQAYVDEVVAVNLGPQPVEVALLDQIPAGAVPLGGDSATTVAQARLEGYASTTLALRWYLPRPGEARQAAASATVDARVVATAAARTWTTATDAPAARPWTESADAEAVLAGLAHERLDLADLAPVAGRCADPAFYQRAVAALRARGAWQAGIWSWSLRHHDATAAGEWLRAAGCFQAVAGPWLHCPLVSIDALADGTLQPVEVDPLVNPRRHRAHEADRDLDPMVRTAWSELLRYLAHKPALDDRDRLLVVGLLLAQDRVEEAVPVFAAIDPAAIPARIQYDWCAAWLALARGDLDLARRLAAAGRSVPGERWQRRWAEFAAQVAEIDGGTATRNAADPQARLAAQAAAECSLALERDPAGGVVLSVHGAGAVELRFRPVDLASLFARAPFAALDGDARRLCTVAAQAVSRVEVPGGSGRLALPLPEAWRNRTAVIEAVAGGASAALVVLANDLEVRIAAASGSLSVVRRSTGAPVAAAYVAVMRRQGETVAFLKDGYTDRRGRFDHVAVSGAQQPAERFAILVEAEGLGATVVQAAGVQGR